MVARIRNDYRSQHPVVGNDIPESAVPYYVGTARLEESANTRMRSEGRVVRRPYPDSEESDDDVIYAEEYESKQQQINLRNEVPNQIMVDSCGERCAQLDDFNWFLPTDRRDEKSDTPESEIDTSDSKNGVYVSASGWSPSQTEKATQRLSGPPPPSGGRSDETKRGCQTAMPGDCTGDGMSGRRTILQWRIQDGTYNVRMYHDGGAWIGSSSLGRPRN